MFRMMKAELFKLRKNRVFTVLCIISLLLAGLIFGMTKLTSSEDFMKSSLSNLPQNQQEQAMQQIMNATPDNTPIVQPGNFGIFMPTKDAFHPTVKELFHGSFGTGLMELLIVILVGRFVAQEYSQGTIKNMLSYGKKRSHYYLAKFFSLSIGFAAMLAILIGVSLLSGFINLDSWGSTFDVSQVTHILFVFLAAWFVGLGIISIMMIVSTLIKSNGSTIGVGLVLFVIGPTLIGAIYGKYTWFDTIYEATPSYNWALATSINATNGDVMKAALTGIITTVITLGMGIMILKKQDIK